MTPPTFLVFWVACGTLATADAWNSLKSGDDKEDVQIRAFFSIMMQDDPAFLASMLALIAMTGGTVLLMARIASRLSRWLERSR